MKKITFFINSLDSGGSERQLFNLTRLLKQKFKIEIFCFKKGVLFNDFKKENIKIISANNNFFSFIFLMFYLLLNNSQLYHFILPKSYILGAILSIFSKKKKVMSRRSLNFYHNKYFRISLFIEKFLHTKMNYIICNSISIKKQLVLNENVNKKKIKIIKNFFFPLQSSSDRQIKFAVKDNKINIAYVANFIPYKGHFELIDMCSNLKTKREWRLFLVGQGDRYYVNLLKKYVLKNKLNSRIIFTGYVANTINLYKKMDFAINCSKEEGSSNSLLEAISQKLPIICFDVGGNKEFFSNNGHLVKYYDIKKFTEALELLIDSNDRKGLGKNSFLHFKKQFDNKSSLKKYEDLYEELLDVH
tara:strand:- start:13682 stop:14758 length:1077 start_codon:yes stop_codon:yes gene_type:complete